MEWVEEAVRKSRDLRGRRVLIQTKAEGVFRTLVSEIHQRVEEIKEKGAQDNPYLRNVDVSIELPHARILLPQPAGATGVSSPNQLNIEFNRTGPSVVVTGYAHRSMTFSFSVNNRNDVVLEKQGEQISVTEAARTILEPFFFPELESVKQ